MFKEAHFGFYSQDTEGDSREIGEIAESLLQITAEAALSSNMVVLDVNFTKNSANRIKNYFAEKDTNFVHIHSTAKSNVLLMRFVDRERSGKRHPGHNGLKILDYIKRNIRMGVYEDISFDVNCLKVCTDDPAVSHKETIMEHISQQIERTV